MTLRSAKPFAIAVAASLLSATVIGSAWAQAGLRGAEDANDFPGSPTSSPPLSPENNAPPSFGGTSPAIGASPSDADEYAPAVTQPPVDPNAPNYGKPRPKKRKLYYPYSKANPPLSPLVPYRRVINPQQPGTRQLPVPTGDTVQPGPTVAVRPGLQPQRRLIVEVDPYAPSGLRTGDMTFLPFVEASTGYETNPNQVQTGIKPSAVLRAAAGVDATSDFSNHSLTASLRGGYSDFPSNSDANRPDANGVVDGRIDVTRNDQINLEGRFTIATQTPGSPLLAVPNSVYIVSRPLITSEGTTLGAAHRFNRLVLDLRGTFDRTQYGDATQSDGSIYRYSQDNYNDYGVVARASYELTPEVVPFAEVGFDSRVRDNPVDLSGYYRDSTGVTGRAGSTFAFNGLFTGTLSAGYGDRHYADSRLPDLRGPTIDGSLAYAVTPLTTITAKASTTFSETTLAGASGAISRLVSLEIAHVFFRHFTLSGIAAYQSNEYQGVSVHETFTQFTLKGAYSFSRNVQLIASISQQNLSSTLVGNGFRDTIFLTGIRLQR